MRALECGCPTPHDEWEPFNGLELARARYQFPVLSADPFVWDHFNDAVFLVRLAQPDGYLFEAHVACGRNALGWPNGVVTADFTPAPAYETR